MKKLPSMSALYASLFAMAVAWTPALAEASRGRHQHIRIIRRAPTSVPELDASLLVVALVLIVASVLVLRGRKAAGSTAL